LARHANDPDILLRVFGEADPNAGLQFDLPDGYEIARSWMIVQIQDGLGIRG
jgi:hypothetical protein